MKHILHLTMVPVENDARILRSIDALKTAGFECDVISPGNGTTLMRPNWTNKARLAASYGIAARIGNIATNLAYWRFASYRQAYHSILAAKPDVIHAHDWDALPAAVEAGKKLDVPVVYDSHEFASEMHFERFAWRTFMSPAIKRLEASNINQCASVIGVSDGICEALQRMYQLRQKPALVRNIPKYEFTGNVKRDPSNLLIHYHGVLARGRGIELAVKALAQLPENYRLRLVGPWRQPGFREQITALAARKSVVDRLQIKPAVKPQKLIALAAQAHIGLCVLPTNSKQNRFALPNKLFEYIAAGLCCIVSSGDDMSEVVERYQTGIVLADNSVGELAKTILNINKKQLATYRQAGLKAAKELCWEQERQRLLAVYQRL